MHRLTSLITLTCVALGSPGPAQEEPSVFRQPFIMPIYARLQEQTVAALRAKDYPAAVKLCEQAIKLAPHYPGAHYNHACALALLGKKDEAFTALMKSIEQGMAEAAHLQKDADFEKLRDDPRFKKAVEAAGKAKPHLRWPDRVVPAKAVEGVVWVGEKNTFWDIRNGVFVSALEKPATPMDKPVITGFGEAGKLILQWHNEGTAAGNVGDFYDNHDEEHSNMGFQHFPQLTRIKFGKDVTGIKEAQFHRGLQVHFFFDGVVLGNASVAWVTQPFWRSMTRLGYTNPRAIQVLHNQYVNSHLYFYPEHHDHDPGHNGQGGGFGDVLPANTPYVITSQGSSGSDRVFMDAVACTLAAFRPEVKKDLAKRNALMPAVQMIFRSSNKRVEKPEDYLTGKAHPSVFEGKELDVLRMVKAAHAISADALPPLVKLRIVEEDQPALGRDYFDAEPRGERLFDTPCAIARVLRSLAFTRRMVLSAEDSSELNKKPLTYHWAVLRGDPKGVTIKKLDKEGKKVELLVNYQERQPIEPGSKLESNRIDIGAFVHNGTHYSAPAFVTFFSLDNQKRTYDEKKRIKEVAYDDAQTGKNYVDPFLDLKKKWRDAFRYDTEGRLLGWTRHTDKGKQEFTPDGAVVEEKDAQGRPLQARSVRYLGNGARGQAPNLEFELGDERLYYEYASNDDRIGKVKKKTRIE